MDLIIDQGNSFTKAYVFAQHEIISTEIFPNNALQPLLFFIEQYNITHAIFSSVADSTVLSAILNSCVFPVLKLSSTLPLPITNAYDTPHTLGLDRLAAVVGAWELSDHKTCLVIDAGTAITYDIITAQGIFEGGNIAPGLALRFKTLNKHTAKLPLVNFSIPTKLFGKSTSEAILNGVVQGLIFEIEGYISEALKQFTQIETFLTGGDASSFEKMIKSDIFVDSNLVSIGLRAILEFNRK